MNAKVSVVVTCVEAIIYLLLHNLHDCNFKMFQNFVQQVLGNTLELKFMGT